MPAQQTSSTPPPSPTRPPTLSYAPPGPKNRNLVRKTLLYLGIALFAALMADAYWAAFTTTGVKTPAVLCLSHLRMISHASLMYATDHRGSLPADLQDIKQLDRPELWLCPTLPMHDFPPEKLKEMPFSRRCSYSYITGLRSDDPQDLIVVYETKDNHGPNRVHYATLDCRYGSMPRSQLQATITKQLEDLRAKGRTLSIVDGRAPLP